MTQYPTAKLTRRATPNMSQGCHFCGESACAAVPGRVTDVLGAQPQSFGAVRATAQPALSAENGIREFVWPYPGARNSAAGRKLSSCRHVFCLSSAATSL